MLASCMVWCGVNRKHSKLLHCPCNAAHIPTAWLFFFQNTATPLPSRSLSCLRGSFLLQICKAAKEPIVLKMNVDLLDWELMSVIYILSLKLCSTDSLGALISRLNKAQEKRLPPFLLQHSVAWRAAMQTALQVLQCISAQALGQCLFCHSVPAGWALTGAGKQLFHFQSALVVCQEQQWES